MIGVLVLVGCGSSHANALALPAATGNVTTVTTLTATTHPATNEPTATTSAAPGTTRGASMTARSTTSSLSAPGPVVTAVSIDNFAFAPAAIVVKVGTSVTWTNNDGEPHTVAFDDGQAHSPVLSVPNATFSHTFTDAGTFTYHCSIHAYMTGTVTVSDA
jgi:plastocyanin